MAAEVGALKVSLGLDSADFSRNITDVNRKLKAVDSEFKATASASGVFGNSLETLKAKQDALGKKYDLHKQKVAELKRQYDESVKSKGADAKETENLMIRYNKAVTEMNKVEGQLKSVNSEIDRQSSKWTQLSDKLNTASNGLKATGDKMQSIGKDLSMKVTAPIMALGTGIVTVGANFEEAMSKVQAVSGATGADLEKLETTAKSLGSTTKYSASEVASAMEYQALAGWKTNQILAATPALLDVAAAGNLSLAQASDIVTDSMSMFKMQAEQAGKASDVFAKVQSSANTNIQQLGEALKYAGASANAAGMDIEQTSAILGVLADNGLKGSIAGTTLNSMLRDMKSKAKDGKLEFGEFAVTLYDAEGNMRDLTSVMSDVEKGLQGMTTEQRDAALASVFQVEAMKGANIILAEGTDKVKGLETALYNSNGAAKEIAKTMSNNTKGGFKEFQSAIEGLSIQFSEHLLPYVNKGVSYVTNLTRKFGELSPETQKTILAIGAVSAAIPPLLIVGGKLITSIGAITGVMSTASTAIAGAGGLSAVLTGLAANPITLTIAGLAGIVAGSYALYNHLKKDAIPEIERFGNEVSESTQKAVGSFLDLNDNATVSLNELSWSGKAVTEEMSEKITSNFVQMGSQIVEGLNAKKDQSISVMRELFSKSVQISEEEQLALLGSVEKGYNDRTARVEYAEQRIKDIMEKTSMEKRSLTELEKGEINTLQREMVNEGIKVLSENEREQVVIFEKMKQNASDLTALQASEVVKNSVEQKDKVVVEAEEQYNKAIAEIIKMRDEAGAISKEQADMLIQEAERQKLETISRAEDQHQRIVEEAQLQASEHVNLVNWETGEILSKWQVFSSNFKNDLETIRSNASSNWNRMKDDTINLYTQMTEGAKQRVNDLVNNTKVKFNEKVQSVKDKMSETKQSVIDTWNQAEQFLTNIDLTQIGKDIIQGLINGIGSMATAVWDKAKSIASGIGDSIKSALQINSPSRVTESLGMWTGKGMVIGLDKTIADVQSKANEIASASIPQVNSNDYKINTGKNEGKNNSGGFVQNITINSPTPLNPSEVARKNMQVVRQLAFEMG